MVPAQDERREQVPRDAGDERLVSMQCQRGRGAPPLALQHARGVGAPPLDKAPRRAHADMNGEGEDCQPCGHAGEGPSVVRSREQLGSPRVLGFPRGEIRLRGGGVHIIDDERPAPVGSRLDLVRDAHGIEDNAPLQHGAMVVPFPQQRHPAKVRGFARLVERRLSLSRPPMTPVILPLDVQGLAGGIAPVASTMTGIRPFHSSQASGSITSSHMKCATLAMLVRPGAKRLFTIPG